ncbi:TetR family transcriptional regulator [Modestobacter sp. L9-4]|uniref:TetR/AcrR family transcriptional regulator n=1 Tax=Modestobacter sp. L9-4 TaxID=2851567 RepID=UPI001C78C8A0|nr:TetR family transcriptional regulator [Modestobacter sp. L9-4]QXG74543.1 TetR family transcriptional regulator [Modestobacter sp. L9-4]
MTGGHEFQRARSPQHKERRAVDLLAAARTLASTHGARTVTLTAIATGAGMHVSGVRRYFDSREDILLALAAEQYEEWAEAVTGALELDTDGTPGSVAGVLAASLADRPLLCDLQAHVPLSLERESSPESVRAFKLTALTVTGRMAARISAVLPSLSPAAALELVGGTVMIAAPLWQMAHPSPAAERVYAEDPRLDGAVLDFVPWLTRLVTALATGLATAG